MLRLSKATIATDAVTQAEVSGSRMEAALLVYKGLKWEIENLPNSVFPKKLLADFKASESTCSCASACSMKDAKLDGISQI